MTLKKARALISRLRTWRPGEKQRQQRAVASLQRQRSAALIARERKFEQPSTDFQTLVIDTVVHDYRNNGRLRQIIRADGHEGTA